MLSLAHVYTHHAIRGRSYLQIVEGYRAPSACVNALWPTWAGWTFGREQARPVDPWLATRGGPRAGLGTGAEYDTALAFGDVYALNELWSSLGFGEAIKRALRSSRRSFDAEALVRAMVFNRLCAPDSKLGCLDWLQTVSMPSMPATVTHDQLLRTMDR